MAADLVIAAQVLLVTPDRRLVAPAHLHAQRGGEDLHQRIDPPVISRLDRHVVNMCVADEDVVVEALQIGHRIRPSLGLLRRPLSVYYYHILAGTGML